MLREVNESPYRLELLEELGVVEPACLAPLRKEADEPVAIFVATV